MKRIIILLFFLFLTIQPSSALTLEGGVTYTVETARAAAFDNIDYQIAEDEYSQYLTNFYNLSDMQDMKNGIFRVGVGTFSPRRLVPFFQRNRITLYGVQYDSNPNKKFYYTPNGKLFKFDIHDNKGKYPYKALSYDNKGRLVSSHLVISNSESYLFDNNKKLVGHWIGNQFYNAKGKKTKQTRRL